MIGKFSIVAICNVINQVGDIAMQIFIRIGIQGVCCANIQATAKQHQEVLYRPHHSRYLK